MSPWLDRFSRADLLNGRLTRMISAGVRGVGAGRAELARGLDITDYDEQLSWLLARGCSAQDAYWELAATDARAACAILGPVYELSQGTDGYVSLEGAPFQPGRTRAAMTAVSQLHRQVDRPNFLVAIPATASGVPAVQATVSAGCNINVTSIFSLARYAAVIDAYQSGLEALVARGGDPSAVHGLASFSMSPVDVQVDRRLVRVGGRHAPELRGLAATAQAILACKLFEEQFSTERWARLARQGATPQRLAWSSAGTDLEIDGAAQWYLDTLSVPNTVQVLSISTITNLNNLGLGKPTSAIDAREAEAVVSELAALRIDLDDIAAALEKKSSALAHDSLLDVVDQLSTRSGNR